jgi:hypothetical protein
MRLTPPKKWVFWASVVLGLLGLIGNLVTLPFVSAFAFWFVFVGLALLVAGLVLKGF